MCRPQCSIKYPAGLQGWHLSCSCLGNSSGEQQWLPELHIGGVEVKAPENFPRGWSKSCSSAPHPVSTACWKSLLLPCHSDLSSSHRSPWMQALFQEGKCHFHLYLCVCGKSQGPDRETLKSSRTGNQQKSNGHTSRFIWATKVKTLSRGQLVICLVLFFLVDELWQAIFSPEK